MILLRTDAWSAFPDIALRLKCLLCNEAVTLRMRMGHATISTRLTLAKYGHPQIDLDAYPPFLRSFIQWIQLNEFRKFNLPNPNLEIKSSEI
jgi:hypothetical protein